MAVAPFGASPLRLFTERTGQRLDCADIQDLGELRLQIQTLAGVEAWPETPYICGAPLPALDPGAYLLKFQAGDAAAPTYTAEAEVYLPSAEVSVELKATRAYLQLSWGFGDAEANAACDGVARLRVQLTPDGEPTEAYTFDCGDSPRWLARSFAPGPALLRITAETTDAQARYAAEASRVLLAGDNTLQLPLAPLDTPLSFDWGFSVNEDALRVCDDLRVKVAQLKARVLDAHGGLLAEEALRCDSPRPYLFSSRRFAAGAQVQLELRAEGGEHSFLGRQTVTLPVAAPPLLTLGQVGTAKLQIEAQTGCTGPATLTVTGADEAPVQTPTLSPLPAPLELKELPYGTYHLTVSQEGGCKAEAWRKLQTREATWASITLENP